MKKVTKVALAITVLATTMVATSLAQQRNGQGMRQMYSRNYDVNTVETIKGEVVDVTYNPAQRNAAMMGVHINVKTKSGTIPVHLGPVWYMSEQDSLQTGDMIEVTGSRITYNGAPAIVAATVKRNNLTLRLRDQNGMPVWRGWRRSSRMNNR